MTVFRATLLLSLMLPAGASGGAGGLLAWQVMGGDIDGRAVCRDGDTRCDRDGTADGACTFGVALCLDTTSGRPTVRVRGAGAAQVREAIAALAPPAACTPEIPVRVRRRAWLAAAARDPASGRTERRRLRLACVRPPRPRAARAVIVTTDFETGLLATVGIRPPHRVTHPATPIHADAVVRVAGDRVYVVNRFLGDNLQVLDPAHGLTTLLQCSTGPGSNPHDVAVLAPDKAYVTRYDAKELWVVDPSATACAGFLRRTVDLSPYADADGIPEMDQMAVVGDRLFVSIQRLDRTRRFAPAGRSRLVVLDTATDAVVGDVELTGGDAFGDSSGLPREPGTGKLVVDEVGDIQRTGDGGLERVDPFTLTAEGFFVTESDLGGNITDFVLVSPTKAYAIVIDDQLHNILLAFDPSERRVTRRLLTRTQYLPAIALAPDGILWLADDGLPAPGIRLFDPSNDRELTRAAIDVGLPPFSMGFVP
jgi:hypothetical protein